MGISAFIAAGTSFFLAASSSVPAQDVVTWKEEEESHNSIFGHARAWWLEISGSGVLGGALGTDFSDMDLHEPRFFFEKDGGFDGFRMAPDFMVGLARVETSGRKETGGGGRFSYWGGRWNADHVLDEPKDVSIAVLPAGTPLESRLTVDFYRIEYIGWERKGPWEYRIFGGLGLFLVRFDSETPSGDLEDGTGAIGFPLGVGGGWHPTPWLFISAEASFLVPFMTGAFIFEQTTLLGFQWEGLRVELGYRSLWADEYDEFRMSLHGYILGVSFQF